MSVVVLAVFAGVLALFLHLRRLHSMVIPDLVRAPHIVEGVEPHPVWGSLAPLRKETGQDDLFTQLDKIYLQDTKRKVSRLHLLFVPSVVVFDPKHVKQVIVKDNYPKSVIYDLLRNFLGDGLLNSAGAKWQQHRTLLNAGFGPLSLKGLIPTFVDLTKVFLREMERNQGHVLDLSEELQKLTIDIISKTGFGYDLHTLEGAAPPVAKSLASLLKQITNPLVYLPLGPKLLRWYNRKHFDLVDNVIFNSIEEKRNKQQDQQQQQSSDKGSNFKDLLDLLLMADSDRVDKTTTMLTKEEIRDEVLTFFLAGQETTASTLAWTLFLLDRNPSCLKKLIEEIDSVLRDPNDPDAAPREPTYEDFPQFKYLTMVLKESLRVFPPVPVLSRQTPYDVEFDGCVVKKGQMVLLPIYTIHHDPTLWRNPEEFDPERWNEENIASSSVNFFAFSHGPRVCIGQQFFWNEAKIVLPMLLSRFSFAIESEGKEIRATDRSGSLKPSSPIKVRFETRQLNKPAQSS